MRYSNSLCFLIFATEIPFLKGQIICGRIKLKHWQTKILVFNVWWFLPQCWMGGTATATYASPLGFAKLNRHRSSARYNCTFYRTRVRSLIMLVTNSLTNSLTHWLLPSKLDWCDPGVWRYQLKTCWDCYSCWCWYWGSSWQQFVDLGAGVCSAFCRWCFVEVMKFNLGRVFEAKILNFKFIGDADVWLRSWLLVEILIMKFD